MLQQFLDNFLHNLFKPLLLFFYAGFLVPIFNVKLEFPKALYQGLTIYLLLSIGWHGGEELAGLPPAMYGQAAGFMLLGFLTNGLIGLIAYVLLRNFTRLRAIDAATVAGYYGSDSAGTFVTCLGVLSAANIAYASYMPVMLAVMEIPGCLIALFLVSRLRWRRMDAAGNLPGETNYGQVRSSELNAELERRVDHTDVLEEEFEETYVRRREMVGAGVSSESRGRFSEVAAGGSAGRGTARGWLRDWVTRAPAHGPDGERPIDLAHQHALASEDELALQAGDPTHDAPAPRSRGVLSKELLHEVFFNPGIFLLFAGIAIGFISRLQGEKVTQVDDALFVTLFQGMLCLFLLEMGMTASKKLRDLKQAGWRFIAFGLAAPNLFATIGMLAAYGYSRATGTQFELGTYVLFAVLCGAASYIALPAVQRMAIPEASPTLPLAASLGLTFSYNVTIGIPLYILIASLLTGTTMAG